MKPQIPDSCNSQETEQLIAYKQTMQLGLKPTPSKQDAGGLTTTTGFF
jgi:hypothetical protein